MKKAKQTRKPAHHAHMRHAARTAAETRRCTQCAARASTATACTRRAASARARVVEYLGERISHAQADARYEEKGQDDGHTFLFVVDAGW
jgi:hypothetical protein